MENIDTKQIELITGNEFENAITEGADVKINKLEPCKSRNKHNYSAFYEIMLASNLEVQSIMNKKTKDRSFEETEKLKKFKSDVKYQYGHICELLLDAEHTAEFNSAESEERPSKLQKMARNVASILKMLEYIGNTDIEKEFSKYGITLNYKKMDNEDVFSQEHIKDEVTNIFEAGKNITQETNETKNEIKCNIYTLKVPIDLQFNKESNPTGIKDSDFMKIVNLKATAMNAVDEEAKEKAENKANTIVGDYIFQIQRTQLMNKKLIEFTTLSENPS